MEPSWGHRLPAVGRVLCLAAAALGAVGLAGWLWGTDLLTTILPGRPAMVPLTGMLLVLVGIGGALRSRESAPRWQERLSLGAGALALALGVGILIEYMFGVDLKFDQLLAPAEGPAPFPGRPSPPTAVACVMLGGALLVFDVTTRRAGQPREWLSLAAATLAFTALVGHLFGARPFYHSSPVPFIGVAMHTGVAILLISAGLLLARPESGIMGLATSAGPGGRLVRRLGLASIVAPLAADVAVTRGLGLDDAPLLLTISTTVAAVLGSSFIVVAARPLDRAYSELEASRAGYRELVEQAPDGIFVADLDGRYIDVNGAGCRLLAFSREEIVGKTIFDLLPPEDAGRLWQSREALLNGRVDISEWQLRRKDGTFVPIEVSAKIHSDGRWLGFARDVTQRHEHDEAMRRWREEQALALKEKDVMLKEIHHRVKNNLQVISSMLYLQGLRSEDRELRQLLDEGRSRVQAIALVHDQLYRSANLAEIDFGAYLRTLAAGIQATYGAGGIEVKVDAAGVLLDIERAVPCGLLVSELLSNAFKHAFPDGRSGKVLVSAREDGARNVVLEVADDGVGIPEGVDWGGSKTLGLTLVQRLTAQLQGCIEMDPSSGTRFTVRFQLPSGPPDGQRGSVK